MYYCVYYINTKAHNITETIDSVCTSRIELCDWLTHKMRVFCKCDITDNFRHCLFPNLFLRVCLNENVGGCEGCGGCGGREGCEGCGGCGGREGCEGCEGCEDCGVCEGCEGCGGCGGCEGCEGCRGCGGCEGCGSCGGCGGCEGGDGCRGLRGLLQTDIHCTNHSTAWHRDVFLHGENPYLLATCYGRNYNENSGKH